MNNPGVMILKSHTQERLEELKKGKYMIEVLPGARKPKPPP